MPNKTKEELEKTNPLYDFQIDEWRFHIASYFGGKHYKRGNYLLQHAFESLDNYNRRRKIAYFYNYCAPIIDIYNAHLFRKGADKDFGSLAGDALFEQFQEDADLEGSSLDQFMRDAQRYAGVYSQVYVIVDKPKTEVDNMADQAEQDIRPYVTLVTPENLTDWTWARLPSGRMVLDSVTVKESPTEYRIWTREGWELWRLEEKGDKPELAEAGEHPLGEVPLVTLYNKRSGVRMMGLSDIQDIADINKNIYYLCSDAKEIIENTAFPIMSMPHQGGRGKDDEGKTLGPKNILQFDPENPQARPAWLEAPHSSLQEIREWVMQDVNEIHRIAKMGGIRSSEDFAQPRSGVAIELEQQQMHATLSEKADNIEQAETQILGLWAKWQNTEFDGEIDYPEEFAVRDLDRDLQRIIDSLGVPVPSPTYKQELAKKTARINLPKAEDATMEIIDAEIEANLVSLKESTETLANDLGMVPVEPGDEAEPDEAPEA